MNEEYSSGTGSVEVEINVDVGGRETRAGRVGATSGGGIGRGGAG